MRLSISIAAASVAAFAFAGSAHATASICDAVSGNLVTNCGFEADGSAVRVPTGWTQNAGYDLEPSFNHVTGGPVNSGTFALSIGNFSNKTAPTLSQGLTDIAGHSYSGTYFLQYGGFGTTDPTPFFDIEINGTIVSAFNGQNGPQLYTQESFSFVGGGSDTLTITGNTNPSEWFVDDIAVVDAGVASVPEPASLALFGIGLAGLGVIRRRRKVA
jgi:hypothetical protein